MNWLWGECFSNMNEVKGTVWQSLKVCKERNVAILNSARATLKVVEALSIVDMLAALPVLKKNSEHVLELFHFKRFLKITLYT